MMAARLCVCVTLDNIKKLDTITVSSFFRLGYAKAGNLRAHHYMPFSYLQFLM